MAYSDSDIRAAVRERYGRKASGPESSCCGGADSNCGGGSCGGGYTPAQLETLPAGAELGLGCGNPTVAAAPRAGETVLDLGSGAGVDCFLAAQRVGPSGKVIGVDMTEEMVVRARANAEAGRYENVEFRLGEIESLPVEDESVDLIVSNCVINLSPEKSRVFGEALRVLRPGGRLVVSDLVADRAPTDAERADMDLYSACVSGAETAAAIENVMKEAGFAEVSIEVASQPFDWGEPDAPQLTVRSATISGQKREK